MHRMRRSEVRGERFGGVWTSVLRRPLISIVMWEWEVAWHGAPEVSLVKKLMPLM